MENQQNLFEGSEKKVELWISRDQQNLRSLGFAYWDSIVKASNAEILSHISNDKCDAFLLSESSLFVYDHKILMITCGETSLINALELILKSIDRSSVLFLVYERKNELFPEKQKSTFSEDTDILNTYLDGKTYFFGTENGRHIQLFHYDRITDSVPTEERTIEVLMEGIFPEADTHFRKKSEMPHIDKDWIREKIGVRELYPGFQFDDHIFNPCGYSINGIKGNYYFTIHITPQSLGSYVSLESNWCPDEKIEDMVKRVFRVFKPRTSDVLHFREENSPEPIWVQSRSYEQSNEFSGIQSPMETETKLESGFFVRYSQFREVDCDNIQETDLNGY